MQRYTVTAAAFAGAVALATLPSTAGIASPLSIAGATAIQPATPGPLEPVQWRGRRNGGAVAAGVAAGIIGGAAAAALAPRYYGYEYGPAYGPPYGYEYGPAYGYRYEYGPPAYEPDYNSGYYYGDTRTPYQRQRDSNMGD